MQTTKITENDNTDKEREVRTEIDNTDKERGSEKRNEDGKRNKRFQDVLCFSFSISHSHTEDKMIHRQRNTERNSEKINERNLRGFL